MSYKDEESKASDGRKPGEPHPDYQNNLDFYNKFIKRSDIIKKIQNDEVDIVFEGLNKDSKGSFETITCVQFFWYLFDKKMSFHLSFHIPSKNFMKDLEKFFGVKMFENTPWK